MNPFRLLKQIYWHFIATPEAEARHNGVKIGKGCLISTRNFPSEGYLVSIGDKCQVTHGVCIHTHGGGLVLRKYEPDYDSFGKVVIEDGVYIGNCAQIMPGVTLGEGSLIAAGSIVTKSVPPGVVVAGNSARVICSVDDFYERNKKWNLHSKGMAPAEKEHFLLSLPDESFIKK